MNEEPRAYTVEEMRQMFIEQVDCLRRYWFNEQRDFGSMKERAEGFQHSLFVMFDGGGALPAFDITPSPHSEDEAYHREEGENWWTTEVINDCQLHDVWNAMNRDKPR